MSTHTGHEPPTNKAKAKVKVKVKAKFKAKRSTDDKPPHRTHLLRQRGVRPAHEIVEQERLPLYPRASHAVVPAQEDAALFCFGWVCGH